jgi:hypothetical protein
MIEGAMEHANIQSARRYLRGIAVALGCIGGEFGLAAPAGALSDQQIRWCNGEDHATPDLMIKGCTGLIRSGKFSGQDLAVAYTNRGSAYDDKRTKIARSPTMIRRSGSIRRSTWHSTIGPMPMAARARSTAGPRIMIRRSG